jgi:hypothetical protein
MSCNPIKKYKKGFAPYLGFKKPIQIFVLKLCLKQIFDINTKKEQPCYIHLCFCTKFCNFVFWKLKFIRVIVDFL